MFLHYNHKIVNSNCIDIVECAEYSKTGKITVVYEGGDSEVVSDPEAVTVIMTLNAAVLEGEQSKYSKNAWVVHNLVGHPLMQILAWAKLTKLSIWCHDVTVPKPKVK